MSRSSRANRTSRDTPLNKRKTWDLPRTNVSAGNQDATLSASPTGCYRKTDTIYGSDDTSPSHHGNIESGTNVGSPQDPTYLTTFGKSVSLDRRRSSVKSHTVDGEETRSYGGQWRSFGAGCGRNDPAVGRDGAYSVPASPRRMPPPSPTTPSLWKKIFSFSKKSGASSERDISDAGRSSTMPSFRERVLTNRSTAYSEYDMDTYCSKENGGSKTVSRSNSVSSSDMQTPTTAVRGSGRRFTRVVNRLISDLKQSSSSSENTPERGQHVSDRGYRSYRRTCSDGNTNRHLDSEGDKATVPTSALSREMRRKAASVIDINGNDENSDKEVETLVQVRRYKCLPSPLHRQLSSRTTPPIVRFSSDEDITSVQSKCSSVGDRNSLSAQSDNSLDEGLGEENQSESLNESRDESDRDGTNSQTETQSSENNGQRSENSRGDATKSTEKLEPDLLENELFVKLGEIENHATSQSSDERISEDINTETGRKSASKTLKKNLSGRTSSHSYHSFTERSAKYGVKSEERSEKGLDMTNTTSADNRPCRTRKSQSQRASSPVQWIKTKYRNSRSRTPSPNKVPPSQSKNLHGKYDSERVKKTVESFRNVTTSEKSPSKKGLKVCSGNKLLKNEGIKQSVASHRRIDISEKSDNFSQKGFQKCSKLDKHKSERIEKTVASLHKVNNIEKCDDSSRRDLSVCSDKKGPQTNQINKEEETTATFLHVVNMPKDCDVKSELLSSNLSDEIPITPQKDLNPKRALHQMLHPPTIKPRPKIKRSVSYSPARQTARTISAELGERIGKLLREPPAIRRRESMGEMAAGVRLQGRGNYIPRRCNSLVSEPVTLCDRRPPPMLLHSISGNGAKHTDKVPFSCMCANNSDKVPLLHNKDCSQNAKCQGRYSCKQTKKGSKLDSRCTCGSRDTSTELHKSCERSKKQLSPVLDGVNDSRDAHRSTKPKRSLAYTRHRHHTIEIASNLAATSKYMEKKEGGVFPQNTPGCLRQPNKTAHTTSLKCRCCSPQVPTCKQTSDLYSTTENSRSKTLKHSKSCSVSKCERSNSITSPALKGGSFRRQGNTLCTTQLGNNLDNKADETFQSRLFLHLGNSSETSVDCSRSKDTASNKACVVYALDKEFSSGKCECLSSNMNGQGAFRQSGTTQTVDQPRETLQSESEEIVTERKENTTGETQQYENKQSEIFNVKDSDNDRELSNGQSDKHDNDRIAQESTDSVASVDGLTSVCVSDGQDTGDTTDETRGHMRGQVGSDDREGGTETEKIIIQVTGATDSETTEPEALTDTSGVSEDNLKRKRSRKDRPKSELGGRQLLAEALKTQSDLKDGGSRTDSSSLSGDSGHLVPWDKTRLRQRRMSTPHPIKMRPSVSSETSTTSEEDLGAVADSRLMALLYRMKRCRSAPSLDVHATQRKRRITLFQASSAQAGDLALQPIDYNDTSDDEVTSEETTSLGGHSLASSGSVGRRTIDQFFEEETPTYAEALWDHVTLDQEELAFQVGEVLQVTDRADKDWWYGVIEDRMGWFPAAFVRLHANQMDTADDFVSKMKAGQMTNTMALQRYSSSLLSKEQARTNVVTEIINAEREYVKHLKDVVEGYVEKARKRPEMFPPSMLSTIFSNIEQIYAFSSHFLRELDKVFQPNAPHLSEIGRCFLVNRQGFEIYSDYCNNHPAACDELRNLQRNQKYKHFFEACRLLQQMIEIPLEGFLLTPVQKICKYPLQLKELLKYTRPEHPDCSTLQEALESMRHIAMLINETKRKLESVEKLTEWQSRVEDWEGPDLISQSSELIHSGEMTKVNSNGWHQERVFFLFDHQLLYCKKDLLWRDLLIYRGRISLDHCEVHSIQDGKDVVYNTMVKNGFKIYDQEKDKWYLMYCKTVEIKDKWLNAFQQERHRVMLDRANGFNLEEYRSKIRQNFLKTQQKKDKKKHISPKDIAYKLPSSPQMSTQEAIHYAHSHDKKTGLLPFLKRKIKR